MNFKMKNILGLTAVALILGACSAESISEPTSENWPADFSVAEYSAVNPDIANFQRKQAIKAMNAKADSNAVLDSAEKALFFDKEAAVKSIFVDYAEMDESLWPGMDQIQNGILYLDIQQALWDLHILGNTASKDLAFLKSVKIDSNLISMQYVLAGRNEGRAYRFCKKDEAKTLQYIVTSTKDSSLKFDTTYAIDTVSRDTSLEISLNPFEIVMTNGTVSDTVLIKQVSAIDSLKKEGFTATDTLRSKMVDTSLVVFDTTNTKIDSSMAYTITKVRTPSSENAVPSGKSGNLWNMSADLYCKEKSTGDIYLID